MLQQDRFATAATADDRGNFSRFKLEVNAFEHLLMTKSLVQVDDADHRLKHDRRHEVVPNQDHDEAKHDRFRRRLANAGGHGGRVEALVAANPGYDKSETHRL